MKSSLRQLITAVRFLLCATLIFGLAYPAVVFGAGQLLAPAKANGSILTIDGEKKGSLLLAQTVEGEGWFYPRPSAVGNNPATSSASNLGPNQPALKDSIAKYTAEVATREKVDKSAVPIDAVTASGSGLDPHISLSYAKLQTPRVAASTGLSVAEVESLVRKSSNGVLDAFLGQTSVNTTKLNAELALTVHTGNH